MPLKSGFSLGTVTENIREMEAAGHSKEQARIAATNGARRYFKRVHPGRELPPHLKEAK